MHAGDSAVGASRRWERPLAAVATAGALVSTIAVTHWFNKMELPYGKQFVIPPVLVALAWTVDVLARSTIARLIGGALVAVTPWSFVSLLSNTDTSLPLHYLSAYLPAASLLFLVGAVGLYEWLDFGGGSWFPRFVSWAAAGAAVPIVWWSLALAASMPHPF